MKQPARLLITAYLATCIAGGGSGISTAAAAGTAEQSQQDLVSVMASKAVISAVWKREPDSYTLQIVLDRYVGNPRSPASPAQTAADAPRQLVPRNLGTMPTPIPNWQEPKDGSTPADRSALFIANTIASLRGLDPAFACRRLSLVDGRRSVQPSQETPTPTPPPAQGPGALRTREARVEVWLLKADGTQIAPATYNCVYSSRQPPAPNDVVSIWYGFPMAEGAQAVAAAIRIDDDFYIEKLQPLATAAAQ